MNVALTKSGLPVGLEQVLASGWTALARFDIEPSSDGAASDFFGGAARAQALLRGRDQPEPAAAIAEHAAYLAAKRKLADPALLSSIYQPADMLTRDAIVNIAAVLAQTPDLPATGDAAAFPAGVLAIIEAAEQELQGWCSRPKALAMARLVLEEKPAICVEIGVFGGRSLIPCAAALAANGAGHIYGIECWDPQEAVRNATNEANDAWWLNIDFAAIKRGFCRFVIDHALTGQVRVLETSSRHVAGMFASIDFLHIDGSHAVIGAAEDVLLYATRVRSGGIIVFDDANWNTTQAAQQMLAALAVPLMTEAEVKDANYAVYRRT